MQWISVEDKLPEIQRPVLVCTLIGDQFVAWREHEKETNRDWRYSECCGCSVTQDITYWMPLPELPKKDENNER